MKTDLSACSVGDNPWIPPAELECGCDRCLEAYERPNYPSAKRQQALRIFERDDATMDHVIPQARGGSNADDNIVTCCYSCNSKKGQKTGEEFLLWKVEKVDCEETRL